MKGFFYGLLAKILGKKKQTSDFAVAPLIELLTSLQLLGDAIGTLAIGGVEGCVEAVGAASRTNGAVAVGTGETSGDAEFLHTGSKEPFVIAAIAVESTVFKGLHALCPGHL